MKLIIFDDSLLRSSWDNMYNNVVTSKYHFSTILLQPVLILDLVNFERYVLKFKSVLRKYLV